MSPYPNVLDLADAAYRKQVDEFYFVLGTVFDGLLERGVSLSHAAEWARRTCMVLGMDYLPLL